MSKVSQSNKGQMSNHLPRQFSNWPLSFTKLHQPNTMSNTRSNHRYSTMVHQSNQQYQQISTTINQQTAVLIWTTYKISRTQSHRHPKIWLCQYSHPIITKFNLLVRIWIQIHDTLTPTDVPTPTMTKHQNHPWQRHHVFTMSHWRRWLSFRSHFSNEIWQS